MTRLWTVACCLFCVIHGLSAALQVEDLRCEYRSEPLGIDTPAPRLSWTLTSDERAQFQAAYRIIVSSSADRLALHQGDCWDSGKLTSTDTLHITYAGKTLQSSQRYYWQVQVWNQRDEASAWSAPACWEMGLLYPNDWVGQWLNDGLPLPMRDEDFFRDDPAPLFRTEYTLAQPPIRARLYITGLGYYEAHLNGKRVGNQLLDPGWTMYRQRVFYSTYDVTTQVRAGCNCLGVMVGNGWYNPLPLRMWGNLNLRQHLAVGRPRFIAQLVCEFADGSTTTIASNRDWKVHAGPVLFNSIYLGERCDARMALAGWDTAGFNDSAWHTPALATEPIGPLVAQPLPPIRITDVYQAVQVHCVRPSVFIYDFGKNFSGWTRLRIQASAGTVITQRYGELLNADGTLNPLTSVCGQIKTKMPRSHAPVVSMGGPGAPLVATQSDTYIASGQGEEEILPHFTFHGFRYVEVSGLEQPLPLEAVTGLRLQTDVPSVGEFSCSNDLLNRIQTMCRQTFQSNLFSVQSDCPHRERFGYGGDIVATHDAFMLNYDVATFYAKAVQDWADSARPDGLFTDTAPFVGIQYCGVGWAMAHPLLVEQLYRYYGNQRLICEHYEAAKRWLYAVHAAYPEGIITDGLSDHESLEPTPAPPLVTPLFIRSARTVAHLARLLNRTDDARACEAMASASCTAYQQRFLDVTSGKAGSGSQACLAFALANHVVPDAVRPLTLQVLLDNIRQHTGHLTTGIMGTQDMLQALAQEGHADVAYRIITQTDFPSWGWMLANQATTLWEHWKNDANVYSHNHPMFGSISQWFINWLGGIQPAADAFGFNRILIRPQFVRELTWVKAQYRSIRGLIVSNWSRDNGRCTLDVVIPANTTAQIELPCRSEDVTEQQKTPGSTPGVLSVQHNKFHAILTVGSGHYCFTWTDQAP